MERRLSVVIPAYNVGPQLPATLRCLEEQDLPSKHFECIIVDDQSTDDTTQLLRAWTPRFPFRLIRNSQNLGRAETRNRGWRAARGDAVVFLDADMLSSPALLRTYRECFLSQSVDVLSGRRMHVGSSSAVLQGFDRSSQSLAHTRDRFEKLMSVARLGQVPLPIQEQLEAELSLVCEQYPDSLLRALSLVTSNVAISRDLLERTGGFSPFFSRGEDTELGIRLARSGANFRYLSGAVAVHADDGRSRATELDHTFRSMIQRHPYLAVLACYAWALRPSQMRSLSNIAAAEQLAALDARMLLEMTDCLRPPTSFWLDSQSLLEVLVERARCDRAILLAQLDKAVSVGVIHFRENDKTYFDHDLTLSWLKDQGTLRQSEEAYATVPAKSAHTPSSVGALPPGEAGSRCGSWHLHYSLSVPRSCLPNDGRRVVANLSLPTNTHRVLAAIENVFPEALLNYRRDDMLVGIPVPPDDDPVLIGYRFHCTSVTDSSWDAVATLSPERFLTPSFPRRALEDLERLLRWILPVDTRSSDERVKRIHSWMTNEGDLTPLLCCAYSAARTDVTSGGRLATLFVNLCQLARVPARARRGVRLPAPEQQTTNIHLAYHRSPFSQLYPEVWLPNAGWIPVDVDTAAWDLMNPLAAGDTWLGGSVFANRLPALALWEGRWQPVDSGILETHMLSGTFVADHGKGGTSCS